VQIKLKPKFLFGLFIVLAAGLFVLFAFWWLNNYLNAEKIPDNKWLAAQVEECQKKDWERQNDCYEVMMKTYLESHEVKAVLVDLESLRTQSKAVENSCHDIAHSLGRLTFEKYGNVGDAFEMCDFTCHSGCYHGVMERQFNEGEAAGTHVTPAKLAAKIPTICAPDKFSNPRQSVIFQCLHGVGHAVLYSMEYDLEAALGICDKFATSYEQSSCYGGVIMENLTAFDKDKRDLKQGDALYPCTKLEDKYKHSCYTMQTSWMFEMGMSTEQIAKECQKVAQPYLDQCFVSLGRDLSGYFRTGNASIVVTACENHSGEYKLQCLRGVIYALVDNSWDAKFAYPFCDKLQQENQARCYVETNYYLSIYYQLSKTEITNQCNLHATTNKSLCLVNIP
jgi:hypothetical protein